MLALLDADIIAFRCAASAENEELGIATWRVDELCETILRDVGATQWEAYLTGDTNFRYQIFPEYKANRLNRPRPRHLAECKLHMQHAWAATVSIGCEADDLLGVRQTACNEDGVAEESVICSIDKDLLTIPGNHYNFVKKEFKLVSPLEAARNFYTQLLTGDSSDGIKGVAGIGPVKAGRLLDDCESPLAMYRACRDAYGHDPELMMNAQVLHIWTSMNEQWRPPEEESRVD